MKGTEDKRQRPAGGREEHAQEHPGPDPVHPEASKPVAGKTPEELRMRQERKMSHPDDEDAG
ncbi:MULTISPECIES: hypothetical protein [Streptomyces]|uniref:Uncharacterized protein n=1 Tax=Streptomyces yangpuensis TaxID=1648182 RepID=A0ABY5Q4Z4_9ACTN|nr:MULTISPECIES: hypothetical protein [Streptomyces]MBZ9599767.1 hypothetical protein [Streptomyces erythrochromogenes]UUY51330.1 hypothetical protein NRK68_31335 [Streptomyces yangpuensis]